MTEYLGFVDEVGMSSNGKYIYRFDFSLDKEIIWGNNWNIAPAILDPNIEPDEKCLSKRVKIEFPYKMELAKNSSCFSMQDCIDGIIAICFPDISEIHLSKNDNPLFFNFGETYDVVVEKLNEYDIEIIETTIVDNSDSKDIEKLANEEQSFDDMDINENDDDNFIDDYDF